MPRDPSVLALACFIVFLVGAVVLGRQWGPRWGFVVLGVGVVLALALRWRVLG